MVVVNFSEDCLCQRNSRSGPAIQYRLYGNAPIFLNPSIIKNSLTGCFVFSMKLKPCFWILDFKTFQIWKTPRGLILVRFIWPDKCGRRIWIQRFGSFEDVDCPRCVHVVFFCIRRYQHDIMYWPAFLVKGGWPCQNINIHVRMKAY